MSTPVSPSTQRGFPEADVADRPSWLNAMARIVLLAGLVAAPWAYGAVLPWGWAGLAILAFVVLVFWALGCVQRGVLKVMWSPLYSPFLGFLLLAVVQFWGGFTYDHVATRESVVKIATDLALFFLAGQLLNTQPENTRSLRWLGLSAIVLALSISALALVQFFTSPGAIYWRVTPPIGWPFGPYVNHNHYGGLMEMLIPIAATYLLSRRSRNPALYLVGGLLAFPIVSILFSGSRGAVGVILIEGVLLGLVVVAKSPKAVRGRAMLWGGVVAVVAVAVFLGLNSGHVTRRMMTMVQPDQYVRGEVGDRLGLARTALCMVVHHPVTGVGIGCFEYAFPGYATFTSTMHWTHVHDDYLEALAEAGLPAALLLLAALWMFFRRGFRHLEERLRHESGWIQVGATVACVGIMCHSFLDFNLRVAANSAWFVVCLAVAVHSRSGSTSHRSAHRASREERVEFTVQ